MHSKVEIITIFQAIMLLVSAIGIVDHVTIIPLILAAAHRDAWVSTLFSGGLLMLWLLLIYFIMIRTQQEHLFVWLKRVTGALAWPIILCIVSILFLMSLITLNDLTIWTTITYLPDTPKFVIISLFLLISFFGAHSGIQTIVITNGILLPFVILFGFFVMFSNIPHKDYSLLFPIFEHGYEPVFKGMIYAGAGFGGMILIVLLQHHIKTKIKLWSLLVTGFILIDLTFAPLSAAIAEFGPYEAARQRFPAFEEWRLVTFGHFVEHVDFLSIYQWLVGAYIHIALGMFLIPDLLHIKKRKPRALLLLLLFVLLLVFSYLFSNNDRNFIGFISQIMLFIPFLLVIITLVLAGAALIAKERSSVQ